MFFPELEQLSGQFDRPVLKRVDAYIAGLSPAARELLTGIKISLSAQVPLDIANAFLEICEARGIMKKRYGLRCPEFGTLLAIQDTPELEPSDEPKWYCSLCEKCHSANDILQADHGIGFPAIWREVYRMKSNTEEMGGV